MRRSAVVLALALLMAGPATAAPADDAAAAVSAVLDKFNGGDIDAFFAAHQADAQIVDEFAPFFWSGTGAVQRWAGDYMKDAEAKGIDGGRMDYGKPIQATSDGDTAYIVLPTTYRFNQRGAKMAGPGSMTFVMKHVGADWKIANWTYSGATAAPE